MKCAKVGTLDELIEKSKIPQYNEICRLSSAISENKLALANSINVLNELKMKSEEDSHRNEQLLQKYEHNCNIMGSYVSKWLGEYDSSKGKQNRECKDVHSIALRPINGEGAGFCSSVVYESIEFVKERRKCSNCHNEVGEIL